MHTACAKLVPAKAGIALAVPARGRISPRDFAHPTVRYRTRRIRNKAAPDGLSIKAVGCLQMWSKECLRRAEECEQLASETTEAFARQALMELAAEFRREAKISEQEESASAKR